MSRKLTLGSLFDGIGGFPLAGKMPEMKHYGDVHGLKGGDLGAVDVITFGSPC